MGVVVDNIMPPQLGSGGHPRRCCHSGQQTRHRDRRLPTTTRPSSLSPLFANRDRRAFLLTVLRANLIPLLLLLFVCRPASARASPFPSSSLAHHGIDAPSVANNNLRFNNNGFATAAASAPSNIILGGTSDINNSPSRINPISGSSSSNEHSYLANDNRNNNNNNNNDDMNRSRNSRQGSSHTISLLDPLTTSSLAGSTTGRASSTKVTYSSTRPDRLEPSPPPPSTLDEQEMQHHHQPNGVSSVSKPKSDEFSITNVTSQLQTHTYLPCKLNPSLLKQKQAGNKSVSWVRVRDDHILTVNRITFITDDRFQSYYSDSNGMWMLQIKWVQQRDAGIYECSVSTEPKVSAQVQLNVVVPKTELVGEQIRYVKDGSNAILRCVVRGALEPPIYISWFYGSKQIYNDSPRGWKIMLDRKVLEDEQNGSHSSLGSLIITSVRKGDSGNYTCSPSNSDDVTVMLHVINGEYSASAITSSSSRGRFSDLIVTIIISVVMFKVT